LVHVLLNCTFVSLLAHLGLNCTFVSLLAHLGLAQSRVDESFIYDYYFSQKKKNMTITFLILCYTHVS